MPFGSSHRFSAVHSTANLWKAAWWQGCSLKGSTQPGYTIQFPSTTRPLWKFTMHGGYSLKHSACSHRGRGRDREGSRRAGDSVCASWGCHRVCEAEAKQEPYKSSQIQISPRCQAQPRDAAHTKAPEALSTPHWSQNTALMLFLQTAWQD